MNKSDSSGFELERERAERCTLIGLPSRDLREWVVHDSLGGIIGCVDQEGNSRFWLPNGDGIWMAAYANLEGAVRAVECAEFVRNVCGIRSGFLQ